MPRSKISTRRRARAATSPAPGFRLAKKPNAALRVFEAPGLLVRMRPAEPIPISGHQGERLSEGVGITVGRTSLEPAGWKG